MAAAPVAPLPPPPDDLRLTRRELTLTVAFWLAWAVVSVGNRVLDPFRGDPGAAAEVRGAFAVALGESLCWMVLTPGLLWLTARVGTGRTPPWVRLLVLGGAGVLVALVIGYAGGALRARFPLGGAGLAPPPPGPPPSGAAPPWFALLNALVLYLGVVAAGLARAYARRAQARRDQAARLEAQLAEARLDALRRQLDPHFLFNTLNAVSTLVERDPRGVRRMIARLGELLRHSFEGDAGPEVPLADELALLGRYVDIMQVRFQGRLAVETRADPAVLDACVPTLIMQPLVENAIKHGVERVAGPGAVTIEAAAEPGAAGRETLVLRVRDNGPGPAPNERNVSAPPRRGVGLRNTVERLAQLYGDAGQFTLGAAPGGGTVAEVRLPLRRAAAAGGGGAGAARLAAAGAFLDVLVRGTGHAG